MDESHPGEPAYSVRRTDTRVEFTGNLIDGPRPRRVAKHEVQNAEIPVLLPHVVLELLIVLNAMVWHRFLLDLGGSGNGSNEGDAQPVSVGCLTPRELALSVPRGPGAYTSRPPFMYMVMKQDTTE
jgi:hypothetical protein